MQKLFFSVLILVFFTFSLQTHALNMEFFQFTQNLGFNQTNNALKSESHYPSNYNWILTSSLSYVSHPLTIKEDNNRIGSILDSLTTFQIGGAYKIVDYFQIGANTSISKQYGNDYDGVYSGDLNLDIIWRFYEGTIHALAVQPRLTLPMGNGNFTSNAPQTGHYLGLNFESAYRWFQTSFNIGYSHAPGAVLMNQAVNSSYVTDLDFKEAIRLGFGALFPLADAWSLNIEAYRFHQFRGDQHPNEIYSGLRFEAIKGLFAFGGLSTGGLIDKSSNDYRVSIGLKYAPYETKKSPKPPVTSESVKPVEKKHKLREKYLEKEKYLYGDIKLATNVYFANNSTTIVGTYQKLLEELHKKFSSTHHYILEGYASDRGEKDYNFVISQKRASVVADYLIKLGVDKYKIKQVAVGEAKAIADIDEALNRKVMIRIYLKK